MLKARTMMKTRPTKKELQLLEVADNVTKRRQAIELKIQQWQTKLEEVQNTCPHYRCFYENKGSTGSWDRDDSFWRNYECLDCGKVWTTDQSIQQDRKYPHAVKGYKQNDEWHEETNRW